MAFPEYERDYRAECIRLESLAEDMDAKIEELSARVVRTEKERDTYHRIVRLYEGELYALTALSARAGLALATGEEMKDEMDGVGLPVLSVAK